jgi:hypothetical protein
VNLRESMLAAADDAPLSTSTVDIDGIITRERRAGAVRRAGIAGLALAAVLGTTLAAPTIFGGREPPHGGSAAPPAGAAAGLDAVGLLRLASQHVADTPVAGARSDQYVFVETVSATLQFRVQGKTSAGKDIFRFASGEPVLSDEWRSVDGTHDGLSRSRPYNSANAQWETQAIPGCRNGRKTPVRGSLDPESLFPPGYTEACTPEPAQLSNLPTDPDAMGEYLYRPPTQDYEAELSADQLAFSRLGAVIFGSVNSPAVLTALYRAAERIPGVTVAADAVDVTGRHGIALVRTADRQRTELIFDPKTYAYLGDNSVVADSHTGEGPNFVFSYQAGDVIARSAITRMAVVDRVGQLP